MQVPSGDLASLRFVSLVMSWRRVQSLSQLQARFKWIWDSLLGGKKKMTGSQCLQDSAHETSGSMTDMLVSWDRAVQLRKVAGASDLCRSSGPHKKAIATGETLDCQVPSHTGLLDKATHSIFVYRTHFQEQVFYSEVEVVKELFVMKISNT